MAGNGKTFVKISNREVYNQLQELKDSNDKQHEEIMIMITGYKSQVTRLQWSLGGVGGLTLLTLGWFVSHLI